MPAESSRSLWSPVENRDAQDSEQYRRMAEQLQSLQRLTAILASARTLQELGAFVIDEVRPTLQADVGVIAVLSDTGDSLRNIAFKGVSDETAGAWLEYPLDSPVPMAEAARTRTPVLVTNLLERNVRYPVLVDVHGPDNGGAVVCLPLLAHDELVGSVGFSFDRDRCFDENDRRFLQALADQCALAVERARWYERAQQEINTRMQFEQALLMANSRKDEFLATLAHELRNPLAPIAQAARIARAVNVTQEQRDWSHNVIERQVRHMSLLLDDLLDVSRITRGKLELRKKSTTVVEVIEAAVETARPLIEGRRHALSIELPAEPVALVADTLRIAQVVCNLLTNAAKYTEPGGQILLSVRCVEEDVVISVKDNGFGIAPNALPRLFEMFSQIKLEGRQSQEGLGIGLALAKKLIELHGGTIRARSDGLGHGSEFTLRLPRA